MNALVLSLAGVAKAATFPDVQLLRDEGWTVTLLVSRLGPETHVPAGVRVIELADAEGITTLSRLERLAVWVLPQLAVRIARRLVRGAEQAGRGQRVTEAAGRVLPRLQTLQPRYSGLAHRRWLIGPYKSIRPLVLWRLVRRCALPELLEAGRDLVVIADQESVTIGWHLARALPGTPVTFGIDVDRLPAAADRGLAVPA